MTEHRNLKSLLFEADALDKLIVGLRLSINQQSNDLGKLIEQRAQLDAVASEAMRHSLPGVVLRASDREFWQVIGGRLVRLPLINACDVAIVAEPEPDVFASMVCDSSADPCDCSVCQEARFEDLGRLRAATREGDR